MADWFEQNDPDTTVMVKPHVRRRVPKPEPEQIAYTGTPDEPGGMDPGFLGDPLNWPMALDGAAAGARLGVAGARGVGRMFNPEVGGHLLDMLRRAPLGESIAAGGRAIGAAGRAAFGRAAADPVEGAVAARLSQIKQPLRSPLAGNPAARKAAFSARRVASNAAEGRVHVDAARASMPQQTKLVSQATAEAKGVGGAVSRSEHAISAPKSNGRIMTDETAERVQRGAPKRQFEKFAARQAAQPTRELAAPSAPSSLLDALRQSSELVRAMNATKMAPAERVKVLRYLNGGMVQ